MAGYHKQGKLHPNTNDMFPMPPPAPPLDRSTLDKIPGLDSTTRNKTAAQIDQLVKFLSEQAKAVMPAEISDKEWLEQWKTEVLDVMDYMQHEVAWYQSGGGLANPNDYVGLTHNNLQVDNAFFWRNEENKVEVGMLDWGVLACGPLINAIQGCISGAEVHVLVEHRDAFLQAFIDSYAESGGPRLELDRLRSMCNLGMMGWSASVTANVSQVLKFTKVKEWPEIKEWNDPRLVGRFQVRAHCTQFKEALQLWQKWGLYDEFKTWKKSLGLPDKKR